MAKKTKSRKKAGSKPAAKKASKPKASKPKAKSKPKASKPSKPKRAAKKAAPKRAKTAPVVEVVDDVAEDQTDDVGAEDTAEKQPGALARLTKGVGKFFAKMTGRNKPPEEPNPDATMEIDSGDIVEAADADETPANPKPPPLPEK